MLFKDTAKIIEYASMVNTVNFVSVTPTLRMVEEHHIKPILGKTTYDALNTAYTGASTESSLTTAQKNLLHQCRMIIGPYLAYYYAPKADVKLSDGGARRSETNTEKTAYQYQVTNFREQHLREAEAAIEMLLQFLEENKADYASWVASDEFKKYRSLFIKTGKEFNELFPSHTPYRNYWAMRSKMQDVEENVIRTSLGDTLYDSLKTIDATSAQSFSAKEKELLKRLKKAIAYFTVSYSIPFLNVRIDANGITVASGGSNSNDETASRTKAEANAISNIIANSQQAGSMWLANAIDYLNKEENEGVFAGWPIEVITSSADIHPTVTETCNTEARGTFGMF